MKRILKKMSMILTIFMMVVSLTAINVFATNSSQDGLVINTSTDKKTYKKGEIVNVTISVTNTNNYDMEDIKINTNLPKELDANKTNFEISLLKANETQEFQVVIENKNSETIVKPIDPAQPSDSINTTNQTNKNISVKTSDSAMIGGWICILAASLLTIVFIIGRNRKIKLLAVAFISIIGMSSLNMHNVDANESTKIEKSLSLVQNVVYDDVTYPITFNVSYLVEKTNESDKMIIHQGETIRISFNSELENEKLITLKSFSGAVIDFAYYSPQEIDIVNGWAESYIVVKDQYDIWLSGKTYADITVLEGELTLDKNKLDKDVAVNIKDTQALIKYVLNKGDTWTFKQKDGINFEELGLSVFINANNGSAHANELIKDIQNKIEYSHENDYSFENEDIKYGLEYHPDSWINELTVSCTNGTIIVYVRSENLGELDIIK